MVDGWLLAWLTVGIHAHFLHASTQPRFPHEPRDSCNDPYRQQALMNHAGRQAWLATAHVITSPPIGFDFRFRWPPAHRAASNFRMLQSPPTGYLAGVKVYLTLSLSLATCHSSQGALDEYQVVSRDINSLSPEVVTVEKQLQAEDTNILCS